LEQSKTAFYFLLYPFNFYLYPILMKIIIRNLARDTTEPQLRALFEEFGEVTSCDLVLDKVTGKSKGFGFTEMPIDKHAKYAIKKLNDKNIANSRIRVKIAEDKK